MEGGGLPLLFDTFSLYQTSSTLEKKQWVLRETALILKLRGYRCLRLGGHPAVLDAVGEEAHVLFQP